MGNVVLVDCQGYRNEGRKRMENLGLGYLGAVLEEKGWSVDIIDANYYGWPWQQAATQILSQPATLIGLSLFYNNIAESLILVRTLRAEGLKAHITLGGHHATFNYREILMDNPEVDSVIRGEAEATLAELAECLATNQDWRGLDNLAYGESGGVIRDNSCRPWATDLDQLPNPVRRNYARVIRETRTASIMSSRGCFGNCSFCSIRAFSRLAPGPRWRGRSADHVADEMAMLVENYGVRHINFVDDDFFGPGRQGQDRSLALAQVLSRRNLDVTFLVSSRPDNLNEKVLQALKQVGLICVDIGIESMMPRQLALYNKNVSVAQNLNAIRLLQRSGLEYRVYLIPFDPYVTIEELWEIAESAQHLGVRHLLDMFAFSHLRVFPQTPIESRLRQNGLLTGQSGHPRYEGELRYTFIKTEVGDLFRHWYGIQPTYAGLIQRANDLMDFETCNHWEKTFGLNLQLLLKQNILDLFRKLIRAYRGDTSFDGAPLLSKVMAALDRGVTAIEEAQQQGRFQRLCPMEFQIGSHKLHYPLESAYLLSERLSAALAGAQQ